MKFLIINAVFYEDISEMMLNGAIAELGAFGHSYNKLSVPGAFEVPAAISYAADTENYDGFISLGCIIKGETIHHKIVAHESARGINDLAMSLNLAIGNGIITVDNYEQALFRADINKGNRGGFAAQAAIKMAIIQKKFFNLLKEDDDE
ncbi:MAG: 6,7-dimethyl-8-ribityllumazine synthase [Rickettsiales bacterium]|jgi:6,7-dimethyl-8-ribityllumazine synthase|nr:6,7-dimethyl-8-ribityllumazine synthase [Rickettsiales bacterium]